MRKRTFLKVFTFLFTLILLVGCSSTPSAKENSANAPQGTTKQIDSPQPTKGGEVLSRVKKSGALKVGFEGTYAPFNFLNDKNQYDGFDVDISNEIAKRMGVKAQFVATQWDGLIGGVKADKFDVIIAQMSITDERKKSVDFTNPYVITGGVIVTRNDTNDITKLEELKGKKVGVAGGTTFEEIARTVDGANIALYKSVNEYIQDLMNKRLDAIINDQLVMGYNIKSKNLPLHISSGIVKKDNVGMATKKGNEDFVEELNHVLGDMKKDGKYEEIYMKWFGVKPTLQ